MKVVIVNAHVTRVVGGSEVQADLLASGLGRLGHQVHYVAVGGHSVDRDPGYALHSVDRSATAIVEECSRIKPDVVYWRFNKRLFFSAARRLSQLKIPVVFSVSHVADTERFASKIPLRFHHWRHFPSILKSKTLSCWNHQGFRYVDGIVVNNPQHLNRLPVRRQICISNSLAPPSSLPLEKQQWPVPYVLWVANVKPQKQPEAVLTVAEGLRDLGIDVLMVGHLQHPQYEYLRDRSRVPSNLHYLGPKERGVVEELIGQCLVLVHTCLPEGFPNVFLQAWRQAKPVVSLCFDPGGHLANDGVGFCSGTVPRMVEDVRRLVENDMLRVAVGTAARQLALSSFDLDSNCRRLARFLGEVATRKGGEY